MTLYGKKTTRNILRKLKLNYYNSSVVKRMQYSSLVREIDSSGSELGPVMPRVFSKNDVPIIEINNTCNIDCLMCKTSLSTRKKGKMPDEIFLKVLERMKNLGIRSVELHTIGDPLANPNLPFILSSLRKFDISTALTTNGLLLKRHRDTLISHSDVIKGITFSIDGGSQTTYERIRFGGKWKDLIEAVGIARESIRPIINVRTMTVVSKDNLHEIGKIITTFRDLVTDVSRDMDFGLLNSLSPDVSYFNTMNLFPSQTKKNIGCKYVSGSSLYILIDGRISVCCRDYDGSLVVGSLAEHSFEEVASSKLLQKLQHAHSGGNVSEYRLCDTCYVVNERVKTLFPKFMKYFLRLHRAETADVYQRFAEELVFLLGMTDKSDQRVKLKGLLSQI